MAEVSKTAQYVALYRALETIEPHREPLFQDPLATRFLSPTLSFAVRAAGVAKVHTILSGYADRRAPGARTSAIARTAFIDDFVRDAIERGTRQLVVLGAGFDCRAHRLAELSDVTVFEVDRQATQAVKRDRLGSTASRAREVRYVAVDFLRDTIPERLESAGWKASLPTAFVWEGVTNYLTEPAVRDVLAFIGKSGPGSSVVFTYIHGGLLDGTRSFDGGEQMIQNVQRLGEPWTFGLHPESVPAFVAASGLDLREDLGAVDYRKRYLGQGALADQGYAFYRVAVADVGSDRAGATS